MFNYFWRFEAIGTSWQIDIFCQKNDLEKKALRERVEQIVLDFDQIYSRFRVDSLVMKIKNKAGRYRFPSNAVNLFNFYYQLYDLTEGKITPLIGQVMVDAGYDADYSFKSKAFNPVEKWEIINYQSPFLEISKPALLDFAAAGKGFLIDLIAEQLIAEGILIFNIDAGRDLYYHNPTKEPLRVGLESPNDSRQVIGVLELDRGSLCASAGNRRRWGNFHHLIDPDSLSSPDQILASWVFAEEAMLADGLATSLFFTSPEKLCKKFDFEFLMMKKDFSIKKSSGFMAELFFA